MNIIKYITAKEAEGKKENGLGGLGGFFQKGMRWSDYKDKFNDVAYDELETLRSSIIENAIRCTGVEHQSDHIEAVPLWENGTVDTYSFRAWGDLMAAVWSSEDGKDYSYMDFYC